MLSGSCPGRVLTHETVLTAGKVEAISDLTDYVGTSFHLYALTDRRSKSHSFNLLDVHSMIKSLLSHNGE